MLTWQSQVLSGWSPVSLRKHSTTLNGLKPNKQVSVFIRWGSVWTRVHSFQPKTCIQLKIECFFICVGKISLLILTKTKKKAILHLCKMQVFDCVWTRTTILKDPVSYIEHQRDIMWGSASASRLRAFAHPRVYSFQPKMNHQTIW